MIPHDTTQNSWKSWFKANRDKVVGIGETGLDYFHLTSGREEIQKQTQRAFFRAQASLALRLELPLIIHTRDAAADTIAQIKESGIRRAVIHCFSENPPFARELLAWSDEIYFSFSGILTYKNSVAVKDTARSLRLDQSLGGNRCAFPGASGRAGHVQDKRAGLCIPCAGIFENTALRIRRCG